MINENFSHLDIYTNFFYQKKIFTLISKVFES